MNNNYWSKQAINERLFGIQEWIDVSPSNITKEELESRLMSRGYKVNNPHTGTTLDSYLESDKLIDKCIQLAKDNLAKMKINSNLNWRSYHTDLQDYVPF